MATSAAKGLTAAIGAVALCAAATGLSFDRHREASAAVSEQFLAHPTPFFPSEREYPGSYRLQWKRLTDSARNTAYVTVPAWAAGIDWVDFAASSRAVGQKVLVNTSGYWSAVSELQTVKASLGTDSANGVVIPSVPANCSDSQVPAIQSTIASLRSLGAVVVLSVGSNPDANCYASADVIVNFDGSIGSYTDSASAPAWAASTNVKFWHRVYGVPQASLATVATQSRDRGATYVWFDPNAAAAEPTSVPVDPFWSAILSAVRRGFQVTRTPAREAFTQQVVIPLYTSSPSDWALVTAKATRSTFIIANAASGPGSFQDPALANRIAVARSQGVKVLGYIATGYLGTPTGGRRTSQAVIDDGALWQALYGVDGFFLDEIQPECVATPVMSSIASGLRALPAGDVVILNPGRNFCEAMVNVVDGAVNYEGYASAYGTWEPSAWNSRYPVSKFWHLLFDVPTGQAANYATATKNKRAGFVFATTLRAPNQWFGNLASSDWNALVNGAYLHADPRLTPPPSSSSPVAAANAPYPAKIAPQLYGGTLAAQTAITTTQSPGTTTAITTGGSVTGQTATSSTAAGTTHAAESLDPLSIPTPTFGPSSGATTASPSVMADPAPGLPNYSGSKNSPVTSRPASPETITGSTTSPARAKTKVATKNSAVRTVGA